MNKFILLLIPGLLYSIDMFIDGLFQQYYSKKCNYNCYKCEVWNCPSHYCNRKREESR